MILVDTNVLLDLVTDDPVWAEWSQRRLDLATVVTDLPLPHSGATADKPP